MLNNHYKRDIIIAINQLLNIVILILLITSYNYKCTKFSQYNNVRLYIERNGRWNISTKSDIFELQDNESNDNTLTLYNL